MERLTGLENIKAAAATERRKVELRPTTDVMPQSYEGLSLVGELIACIFQRSETDGKTR
jgi:hypothetical protein